MLNIACDRCDRILEIVTTLATANKTAMSHLYKLGAFEILLWKLLAGDIVDWDKIRISKFLAQSHLLQVFLCDCSTLLVLSLFFSCFYFMYDFQTDHCLFKLLNRICL